MLKALFVSEDCHQKVKTLSSLEKQSMAEWTEWAVEKAYESQMHNRKRQGKPVVTLHDEK